MRFLLLLAFLIPGSVVCAQGEFQQLFNGKDLTGWSGDKSLWSVEDGCITGRTKGKGHLEYNKFLIWDGTAANFEFHCEFRLEGKNNSGVQYRSVHDKERGEFVCVGYQADIHSKAEFTGMMYDEKGRGIIAKRGQSVTVTKDGKKKVTKEAPADQAPIDVTKWHTLTIIARGNRLIHKIDDEVTVTVTDNQTEEAETDGVIALQVHKGPEMKVQFRNLRLKKFPAKAGGAKRKAGRKMAEKKPADADRPTAQWVWLQSNGKPANKVYFRKEVDSGGVAAARLYAACDDRMKIFVDGKQVVAHDTWQTPVFKDISPELDLDDPQKKHVIAAECENGSSEAGLLIKMDMESGWRNAWSIVTDGSWQASTTPQEGWKKIGFKPDESWKPAEVVAALGKGPWAKAVNAKTLAAAAPLKDPTATPVEQMKIAKGFNVELLYSVPKEKQGSWVNMCVDPKGRLITSDQYGSLYRITPPGILGATELSVEKIDVDIGEAQGLLYAFDALYVSVNRGKKYQGGLYRVTDTDGDDQFDRLETLRLLDGRGEHGPHAILAHPDGKNLAVVCGNLTKLTTIDGSQVPSWDEDLLLPRVQGKFMKGTRAPGGVIYKVDPEGKSWEVMASGFRNQFDGAYDTNGELFAYDADMEWDLNTPWYRPTRICHVPAGAEFGWRSGGGKWPTYYPDSVPPVVNIGPGSPTGVCFGYGADFPAKYQQALFACDWSYGKLYAVHMTPKDGTFVGQAEEFITGTPLPLTDVVINPVDKAMYFTIGGRKVQSGLYKVTAEGGSSPVGTVAQVTEGSVKTDEAFVARRSLEPGGSATTVAEIWPHLSSPHRAVRYAARLGLERIPHAEWSDKAFNEDDDAAKLTALLALCRSYERSFKGQDADIDTQIPDWEGLHGDPANWEATQAILDSLDTINVAALSNEQALELLRVISLAFVRISPPNQDYRGVLIDRLQHALPGPSQEFTSEVAQLAVYLQAPYAAAKLVEMLEEAPTQEEQIDYARTLRHLKTGWTPELQERYFKWFTRAAAYSGGSSFQLFVTNIKKEAVANLSDADKQRLKPILEAKPPTDAPVFTAEPRSFVKKWTMKELVPLLESKLEERNFDNGRKMFGAATCFACHRFDNQGGSVGPDLTSLSGRFSSRDILESVMEPSKQISDQYGSVQIVTLDGKVVTGRIINLAGDSLRIQTDMMKPGTLTAVDRKQIDEMVESKVSMMPQGLLNTLNEQEVLDLMAYLLSRGDRNHKMFREQ